MTKVYELPEKHLLLVDYDESKKLCTLHETQLDSLVSKLNYYAEGQTGHWVLDDSDNSLECDECGCRIYASDIMNGEPHYCPNCGVRMVESEDE